MKNCVALIIPSIWYEVSPLVYIEGLMYSRKVIVPNIANFNFLLNKNNQKRITFFQFGNFIDLRGKIINFKTNSSFRTVRNSNSNHEQTYFFLIKEYRKVLHTP